MHSVTPGPTQRSAQQPCEREVAGIPCTSDADGAPAEGAGLVDGRWYCEAHLPAARALASKRRDRGFGSCSTSGCDRPAVEQDGKCIEHRAGELAAGSSVVVQDGTGKGDHPYAAKQAEIYLVAFPELGLLKVGRATPWTVRNRVRDAAEKIRVRHAATLGGVGM